MPEQDRIHGLWLLCKTYSEGLLVSDLHHAIHNIEVDGPWNGVLAHTLTLVGLGLQLLLSHLLGPEVPENRSNRVRQHDMDVRVHVLQETPCARNGATSAASSNEVGDLGLGLHPDLQHTVPFMMWLLPLLVVGTRCGCWCRLGMLELPAIDAF